MIGRPPRSPLFPYTTLFRPQEFAAILAAGPPAPKADPWRRTSGVHGLRNRRQLGMLRSLWQRSEEHTSELQSRQYLVCRLLLEKKKNTNCALPLMKHLSPLS